MGSSAVSLSDPSTPVPTLCPVSSILTLPLQCQSPLQPPGPASCPGLRHRQPPPKPCATPTPAPTLGIQADTGATACSEQGKLRASQRLDLGRKRSQRGWEEKHGQGLCHALWDGWARHCDGSELCTAHPSLAPALRQSPMPPSMVIHLPSPDAPSPRGRAPAWSAGTVPLFWSPALTLLGLQLPHCRPGAAVPPGSLEATPT